MGCTLILTQGDSAKALAVCGLAVVGRDSYGVFPLRHMAQLNNARNASLNQLLSESSELEQLLLILGLSLDPNHRQKRRLRYGRVMLMTNWDEEGRSMRSVLIDFLNRVWPDDLKYSGFLSDFIFPAITATRKKDTVMFNEIAEYEHWKTDNNNGKGWQIMQHRTLGSFTASNARHFFAELGHHCVPIDPETVPISPMEL